MRLHRVGAILLLLSSCQKLPTLAVSSPSFEEGAAIPKAHTADGADISPALSWSGLPPETKSVALICDDPDAPDGTFTHWIVYNIPPAVTALAGKIPIQDRLPDGSLQGRNDFGKNGYSGPSPPSGTHRYFFRIYALDAPLDLKPGATREQLDAALKGRILARGERMGRYTR